MKKKNKKKRIPYSVTRLLRRSVWLTIPLGVLFLLVSIYSFFEIQKQNRMAVEASVGIYQEELAQRLKAVQHFVDWTVVHDPILDAFRPGSHMGDYTTASGELRSRVSDVQYATGNEYQYFFYWKKEDFFINASEFSVDYSTYLDIKQKIIDGANSELPTDDRFSWRPYFIKDRTYLCYSIHYNDHTFASVVALDDLLEPLDSIAIGKYGSIHVTDSDHGTFYETAPAPSGPAAIFYNPIYFPGEAVGLPLDLEIYSDLFGNYGRIFFLQFLVFVAALIMILITGGYLMLTYRNVIRPIKIFSENLSRLDSVEDTAPAIDLTDNSIKELNQINEQFKNLTHEITRLRINIYESELARNRFQIHFLQQQIKPHFYLNCLTTIDSMLSIGEVDTARKMLQFTSRYLRYLFQADKDYVHLKGELSHIEDYINIQNLRLGNTIRYSLDTSDEYDMVKVPPLLLITFVENVIKHAIPKEEILQLTISCKKPSSVSEDIARTFGDQECFEIKISDNGQGLPEETIDRLSRQLPIAENGEHIGITNSWQRLRLLYNDTFLLKAENSPEGGAIITIMLPYQLIG